MAKGCRARDVHGQDLGPTEGDGARAPTSAPVPVPAPARMRKSVVAVILEIDTATTAMLGWSSDEMVGRTSVEFIHPEDQELAVENWMQMLGAPGPGRQVRIRHKHSNGSWVWLEMVNHNRLDDGADSCIVAEMVDVTAEMKDQAPPSSHQHSATTGAAAQPRRLHEALGAREEVLHRLAEALPLGVLQVDAHGRVVYTNRILHTILGTTRASTVEDQLAAVVPEQRQLVDDAFATVLRSGLDNDFEMRLSASDERGIKEVRQCNVTLRALFTDNGTITGAIACVADVTESVRMREELRVRATFDDVTKCHNRATTMEALENAVANSHGTGRAAVIFVDLDRFKDVNDRLGHGAGDELLEVAAKRLLRSVRTEDVVGRIGGDEFLVVCPGITTATQAMRAAMRVADSLRHQVRLKAGHVSCQASIGVAWSSDAPTDPDTLVKQADAAMYLSKAHGFGRPVFYTPATPGNGSTMWVDQPDHL